MSKLKTTLIWILAMALAAGTVIYQRVTGPTYPVGYDVNVSGSILEGKLPRTHGGPGDEIIKIIADPEVSGFYKFKRYKSHDEWTFKEMERSDDTLYAALPFQPPAGKIIYEIYFEKDGAKVFATDEPVIIRFKGAVPDIWLILHVAFMVMSILFSYRILFEILFKGNYLKIFTLMMVVIITMGGLVFGPIIQKFSFGAYWTGWPFGHDLTDNKTFVSFFLWLLAYLNQAIKPDKSKWKERSAGIMWLVNIWRFFRVNPNYLIIIAVINWFAANLIPHSTLGSEIDYTKLPKQ